MDPAFSFRSGMSELSQRHGCCKDQRSMKFITNHIKPVEAILATLFLVSVSGFSTVLHSCLMTGMSCCMSSMPHRDTQPQEASQPSAYYSNITMTGCCSTRIVGGLSTSLALLEHQHKFTQSKFSVLSVATPASIPAPQTHLSLKQYFSLGEHIPPSSVEKYVFNSSYLI